MIEINNLNKFYNKNRSNELHVINNMNLSLPDNGLVAFYGKSGCGKTTLLNVIGGLDQFDNGQIIVDGKNILEKTDDLRNECIGYIFQNYCLNYDKTVYENVADSILLLGVTDKKEIFTRVMTSLKSVKMDKFKNRKPNTLSGGQQQRVAIARALAKGSKIILADEPTGNLDEENTIHVMNILKEISKNCLVLLVTHETDLVNNYCDKIISLVDGKIEKIEENDAFGSIVASNKNKIYLGDLPKHTFIENDYKIELYGDVVDNSDTLIIVNKDGQLYVKSLINDIKVINKNSEVQFVESKLEDEKIINDDNLLIAKQEQIVAKDKGNLFKFFDSFKNGFEMYFKRGKKGRKLMMGVFSLLSIIIVFLVANFGTCIYKLEQINKEKDDHFLYVKVSDNRKVESVRDLIKDYDVATYTYSGLVGKTRSVSFRINGFETASITSESFTSFIATFDALKNAKYVVGEAPTKNNEIVITTALANSVIDDFANTFINSYEKMLLLTAMVQGYDRFQDSDSKVVGVVDDESECIFVSPYYLASENLQECLNNRPIKDYNASDIDYALSSCKIIPQSESSYTGEIPNDKVVYSLSTIATSMYDFDTYVLEMKSYSDYEGYMFASYTTLDVITNSSSDAYNLGYIILNDDEFLRYLNYNTGSVFDYYFYEPGMVTGNYLYLYMKDNSEFGDLKTTIESADYDVVDADELVRVKKDGIYSEMKSIGIPCLILLALMFISMFLIMRSSLMSRVKEVGIYRAIGVKKGNIVFKFFTEAVCVFVISILSYFIISYIMILGTTSVGADIMATILYFPWWLALSTIATLFIVCVVCGIIPVIMLLYTKTPAEILAKYDI